MITAAIQFFRGLIGCGIEAEYRDGFGQSIAEDIRYLLRFRRCRGIEMGWRVPTDTEAAAIEAHPILSRFGDLAVAVADVDGRHWIVREQDWHGWPDPPQYVFFAMEDDVLWAVGDFDRWPGRWLTPVDPHSASIGH